MCYSRPELHLYNCTLMQSAALLKSGSSVRQAPYDQSCSATEEPKKGTNQKQDKQAKETSAKRFIACSRQR